jgi:hypothetical protein
VDVAARHHKVEEPVEEVAEIDSVAGIVTTVTRTAAAADIDSERTEGAGMEQNSDCSKLGQRMTPYPPRP